MGISSNTKFRLLTALVLNTFLGLRTSSFLICWAALELNLVLFLPFIIFSSTSTRAPQGLVYFFIQRVSGLVLFSLFMTEFLQLLSTWKEIFLVSLFLLKLGGFPFHSWVLALTSKLTWESVFLLLTVQKFLPLFIIVFFIQRSLLLLVRLGFSVLSVQALRAKTLKVLIVFSSVFFMMGVLGTTAQSRTNWIVLFFIYSIIFSPLVTLEGGQNIFSLGGRSLISLRDIGAWLILLLRLSGVPLLPGFILKLEFLLLWFKGWELFLLFRFILSSIGFIYLYVSVALNLVSKTGGLNSFGGTIEKTSVVWLLFLIRFLGLT